MAPLRFPEFENNEVLEVLLTTVQEDKIQKNVWECIQQEWNFVYKIRLQDLDLLNTMNICVVPAGKWLHNSSPSKKIKKTDNQH